MNREWTWILGSRLRKKYVGLGQFSSHVNELVSLSGWRRKWESLVISFSGVMRWRVNVQKDSALQGELEKLQSLVGGLHSAFLLITSGYKESSFVGPASLKDGRKAFIKLYKDVEEAKAEQTRSQLIQRFVGSACKTAYLHFRSERLIGYEYIPHSNVTLSAPLLEKLAMDLSFRQFAVFDKSRLIRDMIPFDQFCTLITERKQPSFIQRYEAQLKKVFSFKVETVLAHGDFVPWNIFYGADGHIYLVDYERTALRTPYYDVFHLYTQPASLKGHIQVPDRLFSKIAAQSKTNYEAVLIWYTAYILDQLLLDMNLRAKVAKTHWRLPKIIDAKISMLEQLLELHASDSLRTSRI